MKQVNAERLKNAIRLGVAVKDPDTGKLRLSSPSFDAEALAADPSLELSYIVAPPRMKLYEKISTQIFGIYSKYISADDIHVYSIDECFLDVTAYLNTYHLTAHEPAMTRGFVHNRNNRYSRDRHKYVSGEGRHGHCGEACSR